jgi:glycosyltransferase involved in cell wall biosynthesis
VVTTTTQPMVDVVLPAYNGVRVIREALDSALAQEGVSSRVIVVDDGSTDDTAQVVRSYGSRITLRSQSNKGVSGARNTGLGLGEAPYVALLDQDDVWLPGKLARQVDLLRTHGNVGLVFTDMTLFQDDGEVVEDGFLRATPRYALLERCVLGRDAHLLSERAGEAVTRYNFISPSTVMLRRRAIEEVGGFDERLRLCDDAECWMRLLRTWRAIAIEKCLVRSRVWAGNASLHTDRMLWERVMIAEKVRAHPELYPGNVAGYLMRERAACLYRLGTIALRDGELQRARRHFLTSFRDSPRGATVLLLAASFLGPRGRRLLAWARRAAGVRMAARVD